MVNLSKRKMKNLDDVILLTDMKEKVFEGYTTYEKADLEGKNRTFKDETLKYYLVTSILDGNLYISKDKLGDVITGEAQMDGADGIYEHGYPEERLVPSNHKEESEEKFFNHYIEEFEDLIKDNLADSIL